MPAIFTAKPRAKPQTMANTATCTHAHHREKPRFELADIFWRYGAAYRAKHKLTVLQHKVMRAIQLCRTQWMGGHTKRCDQCGYTDKSYDSCRNRHCPKCQGALRGKWISARLKELLPIHYYHVVFTLPHLLNALALYNKEVIYEIFYQAAAATLVTFGWDPKYLGAQLGLIAVLHTWGQTLSYHVHWHFIVTAGGLSAPQGGKQRWIRLPYRKKFLFPDKAVSKVIRGKFIDLLDHAYRQGKLRFPDDLACLTHPVAFEHFKLDIGMQNWYWYAKKPFAGPERLIKYIGRYTHRVAISNSRLLDIDGGNITFSYKDYRDGGQRKPMSLSAEEFIRRWRRHVVPKQFRRIRYGGFLSGNSVRRQRIELARKLLGALYKQSGEPRPMVADCRDDFDPEAGMKCPMCKHGTMILIEVIPRARFVWGVDSS